MMKNIFILLVVVGSMNVACSKSENNAPNGNDIDKQNDQASELIGHWITNCQGYEYPQPTGRSTISNLNINATEIDFQIDGYYGKNCTGKTTDTWKIRMSYDPSSLTKLILPTTNSFLNDQTYIKPGISSANNYTNINTTMISMSQVVYDQDMANLYNTIAYCGFTDWVVGIEKDITGLPCMTGANKAGQKIYSIFSIDNHQLKMGEADSTHDGLTPEARHVKLSDSIFSRK